MLNNFIIETLVGRKFEQLGNREFTSREKAEEVAILDYNLERGQFRVSSLQEVKNRHRASRNRQERDQVRRDCGLVRVRGALGGVYWE
jgi:hypothetical protein